MDYSVIDNVDPFLAEDHDLLLPISVAPVRSTIGGVDNHVVVSIEHWAHTSVVLVYTPDEHQQMPSIAPIAVGRDSIGRTYDVRSEVGGTWCGGAASYLRVTPRLPRDVDVSTMDLFAWSGLLVLDGDLARAEPKRLRYCLLHTAGQLMRASEPSISAPSQETQANQALSVALARCGASSTGRCIGPGDDAGWSPTPRPVENEAWQARP